VPPPARLNVETSWDKGGKFRSTRRGNGKKRNGKYLECIGEFFVFVQLGKNGNDKFIVNHFGRKREE